ncbi:MULTISPECIES: Crp/Fnr family transcriptional regulator [Anaerofustis]|uniref:Crp/Fnr family transcriptional regulator n=1 Tax=Anaerofustis TaxID=264995 RepID=UPI001484E915|nr:MULTISPECIES: Crp/Fnr family transcriptional regulator [Anaerofustis]MCO8194009.1 Crp/Fnr family transcriptional regulator [Anaerofustis sp. NSJ-163]
MKNLYEKLKKIPLFNNVQEKEINEIIDQSYIKSYQKDEYILKAGDFTSNTGIILKGEISVISEDFWGNKNIISTLSKGNIFAEIFSLKNNIPLNVSVISNEDSTILFINVNEIINKTRNFIFIKNLMNIISTKTLMLNRKNELLSKRTIREKVMTFLSQQAISANNNSFKIPFSREEMANFLAVDRSALSRELSKMKKEGIITYNKNNFTLITK